MRTPTIEVTRTYDSNIEAQLKALEILLRSSPQDDGHDETETTLDVTFGDTASRATAHNDENATCRPILA
jgi:hypothetical protein